MTIGERIRERRLEKSMSLRELSAKLGITAQTLQRYETGAIKNIGPDMVNMIADALGTSSSWLIGSQDRPDAFDTVKVSKTESLFLQIFRDLPADDRRIVAQLLHRLNDYRNQNIETQRRLEYAEDFLATTEYDSDYRREKDEQFREYD